jgi:lysozyme family protein
MAAPATPQDIIDGIIQREGDTFTNKPADKGGPTKYGITQATLTTYWGRPATADDVKNLDRPTAVQIYQQLYIDKPGLGYLPNPPQVQLVDMAVLHGPKNSAGILQNALNVLGVPVKVTGLFDAATVTALNTALSQSDGPTVQNAIVDRREKFMRDIVARDPSQQQFLPGWLARAEVFRL